MRCCHGSRAPLYLKLTPALSCSGSKYTIPSHMARCESEMDLMLLPALRQRGTGRSRSRVMPDEVGTRFGFQRQ
jgi:hypothetical protein